MRLSPLVLVFGLAASSLAVPGVSQRPDDQLTPKSVALVKQGEASAAAGRYAEADDAFETALAVDPRNRAAFVAMARVAAKQKLYGQAIRFTNKALSLEPTDRSALAVQGQAMVEIGAAGRAKEVLAKLQTVCAGACPEATTLSAAIARGPTMAAAKPAEKAKTKTN
ncbi:tetratricopeptide repeat protein [Sphingomonas sp.]|uniref:tetratricopeptide repeat protein n=1 Tax=Sphingomonas sp. TaxID=28214 RepID=UPI00286AEC73|nr:tetratricopeptide repeat protein [Sphingomonas sp.]